MWIASGEANGISFFGAQRVLQARAREEVACSDQLPSLQQPQSLLVFDFVTSQVTMPAFDAQLVLLDRFLMLAYVSRSGPVSISHLD